MVGLTCYFYSCTNNLLAQTNFTSNCLESCGKKILSSSHHYYMNLMVDQSLGNLREKKILYDLVCFPDLRALVKSEAWREVGDY